MTSAARRTWSNSTSRTCARKSTRVDHRCFTRSGAPAMSANPPEYAVPARGLRARVAGWSLPQRLITGWSLRRRLLAGILALFAIAFVIIGVVSTVAMHQVLIHQVDGQLTQTSRRAGGGPPPGGPPPGYRGSPNFVGQPAGTLNARVS